MAAGGKEILGTDNRLCRFTHWFPSRDQCIATQVMLPASISGEGNSCSLAKTGTAKRHQRI
jgi:hypothetical protein